MSRRLVYVSAARLPTERAHGVQISRMCEAFAALGVEVLLLHPHREQSLPAMRGVSIFDYYGIAPSFTVRTLRNWDFVSWERWIPQRLLVGIGFLHALCWSLYAAAVARREPADLYFTRDVAVAYWLTRFGLPTAFEAHMVPKRAQRYLVALFARRTAFRLLIAVTPFVERSFRDMGVPREKIVVQPNGVDLGLFERLPGREDCRRRLGLPAREPIVGYVGRFETMGMEKGIVNLVRSMATGTHRARLVCVGGPMDLVPSYEQEAQRMGIPAGRVCFVDQVPHTEVPLWIRACDVVTIPWPWTEFSAHFTSPLKLFEYMAGGTPIVASDLPCLRSILRDGENARLVSAGDPFALSAGIADLLNNPGSAAALAAQAREDVAKRTWTGRAAEVLSSARVTVNADASS